MPMQLAVPDMTKTNEKMFLSPTRDLAYMMPKYLVKAIRVATAKLSRGELPKEVTEEKLEELAKAMAVACNEILKHDTMAEVAGHSGLVKWANTPTMHAMSEALWGVIWGAFFNGIRFCVHPGEKQFIPADMDRILEDGLFEEDKGPVWKRWIYRLRSTLKRL